MFDMPLTQEVWIIDETQKTSLESILAEEGLTPEYMNSVLAKYKAAEIRFGQAALQEEPSEAVVAASSEPHLLWSDEDLEIYYPANPCVRHHLMVMLKRPVSHCSEVTAEEALKLKSAVNRLEQLLASECDVPAVVAFWNRPQPGHPPDRFVLELLPAHIGPKNTLNVLDKMDCNNYLLYRNQFSDAVEHPSSEQIQEDLQLWKELSLAPVPFTLDTASEPIVEWTLAFSHQAESACHLRKWIQQILAEKQIPIESKQTDEPMPNETSAINIKGCPFCSKRILEAESIVETPFSHLLFNFRAEIPGEHLLIFPKRHVKRSDSLREEEVRDLHLLTGQVISALEQMKPGRDIICYTQEGPEVAQKVLHTHTHILLIPPTLRYMLYSMNYINEPTLTQEQMQQLAEELRAHL